MKYVLRGRRGMKKKDLKVRQVRLKVARSMRDMPVELRRLLNKQYPTFVTSRKPSPLTNEIPVFMFHRVEKKGFREQLEFLKRNGYRTLSLEMFIAYLKGEAKFGEQAVFLTFDDGEKSLYQVAFPLLKEYGFHAAAFVIPHFIRNEPNHTSKKGMVSWPELEEMDKSGVVDVQSHSYYHDMIFTGPDLEDFYHPNFDHNPLGIDIPWVDDGGTYSNQLQWGTPIYRSSSRLGGHLRYLDDLGLRQACTEWVSANGGVTFFNQADWRRILDRVYKEAAYGKDHGCFETRHQQRKAILENLLKSKNTLEEKLNKPIRHLCLPRGEGCRLTSDLSKEAGYSSIFWVTKNGRQKNQPGDPLDSIVRVKDDYLLRLPGDGRQPLLAIFKKKLKRRMETLDLY